MAKVEAIEYGDRKVFSVSAFNRGLADWLGRLPTVWVEGEITELRRQERWQTVFFTLKDKDGSACVEAALPRRRFDALGLDLANGERVHVYGRPEVWPQKGELRLQVLSIERFGLGAHLAALERLKQKLAAEGLFAAERKRALPRLPRRDRPRHRQRRSGQARRDRIGHHPVPSGPAARGRDAGAGASCRR